MGAPALRVLTSDGKNKRLSGTRNGKEVKNLTGIYIHQGNYKNPNNPDGKASIGCITIKGKDKMKDFASEVKNSYGKVTLAVIRH